MIARARVRRSCTIAAACSQRMEPIGATAGTACPLSTTSHLDRCGDANAGAGFECSHRPRAVVRRGTGHRAAAAHRRRWPRLHEGGLHCAAILSKVRWGRAVAGGEAWEGGCQKVRLQATRRRGCRWRGSETRQIGDWVACQRLQGPPCCRMATARAHVAGRGLRLGAHRPDCRLASQHCWQRLQTAFRAPYLAPRKGTSRAVPARPGAHLPSKHGHHRSPVVPATLHGRQRPPPTSSRSPLLAAGRPRAVHH